jgi:hypothetical protein
MSTTLDQKSLTVAQRTAKATEEAAAILGLDEVKLVGAVVLESALEELRQHRAFAQRVREAYQVAVQPKPKKTPARKPAARPAKSKVELKPLRTDATHQINIAAAIDPYYLNEVFGPEQLPLALGQFSAKKLMDEAVPLVQRRHPGTVPSNKRNQQVIIAYIVHHVAGG